MMLVLDEVRRLTGPNLLWDKPGAIIDVFIDHTDKLHVISCWQKWVDKLMARIGWQQAYTYRLYEGGASMALSAPMDALYTACDLAELAWECCVNDIEQRPQLDWQSRLANLKVAATQEYSPRLIRLLDTARQHGVMAISDDDEFSLGTGSTCDVWAIDDLPDINQVQWSKYRTIPTAFITGTNGKSTSVRLASEIAKAAGILSGVTSTDFIRVGDDIIDTGDYSGPGGARMLLRDKRTEMAFLEVARGGILRRGLPISDVDAVLITNVESDHLGQYGINRVEELAQVKFVTAKGLGDAGVVVLNADNHNVVAQAKNIDRQICWFSENREHPIIQHSLRVGLPVSYTYNGRFFYTDAQGITQDILAIVDAPMTFHGAAVHNIQNALGVIGLAMTLSIPVEAIRHGLTSFGSGYQDNPGRGNMYHVKGTTVIVDFAHNAHSMNAMVNTAKQMTSKRLIVMFSNAGDRSNEEVLELTDAILDLRPNTIIVAELEKYLRGREPHELTRLVKGHMVASGIEQHNIQCVDSPLEGARLALSESQEGDLIILFALDEREQIHELLN